MKIKEDINQMDEEFTVTTRKKHELCVSFAQIVTKCKTMGDLDRLDKAIKRINTEMKNE